MIVEIKFSDKEKRMIDFYLGNRYGSRKKPSNRMKAAIREVVSKQATVELKEIESCNGAK